MMEGIDWVVKPFEELTATELYEILRLRSLVFVVEQNCVFLDMDRLDEKGFHVSGYVNGQLAAYTRILPKGVSYPDYPSIGRVVTAPSERGKAYGFLLMEKSIEVLFSHFGLGPIKIGAQIYLKKFYESLGFKQSGEVYLEDGIEHIPMIKS